ncbi:hypothetical protein RRG08_020638 [Elysia crispata]|uniref:Gamma-glutamylcyclotransferase family protein n=1 Tax=Elysia crispata TaxID=231223 RepID=A0AAE1ABH7_9GAST|nr:hypothetical protein RRG08_020638 [Elysia crispata]
MSHDKDQHYVFVYGTLKTGQPNHYYLTEDFSTGKATLLGTGETMHAFPLVVATVNNLPFLLPVEGKGENVQGEIYEIDDQKLYWLDDFESHPSWYKREIIEIRLMDGTLKVEGQVMTKGDVCQCWVYFLPGYKPEMLALKMLKSYASLSPDHLPYNTNEEMTSLEDT